MRLANPRLVFSPVQPTPGSIYYPNSLDNMKNSVVQQRWISGESMQMGLLHLLFLQWSWETSVKVPEKFLLSVHIQKQNKTGVLLFGRLLIYGVSYIPLFLSTCFTYSEEKFQVHWLKENMPYVFTSDHQPIVSSPSCVR